MDAAPEVQYWTLKIVGWQIFMPLLLI